jgi:hypothetical protein
MHLAQVAAMQVLLNRFLPKSLRGSGGSALQLMITQTMQKFEVRNRFCS